MQKCQIIAFVFCSVFFLSCSKSKNNKNDIEQIKAIPVKSIEYEEELIIHPPQNLSLWNESLLISGGGTEGFFTFCNKDNLLLNQQWGNIGAGPEEFISPQYAGTLNDKLYAFDFNMRQLFTLGMNKDNQMHIQSKCKIKDNDLYVTNLHVLDENYILGSVLMGKDNPVVVFDENLNVIDSFGKIAEHTNVEQDIKSYVGRFASQKEYFVYAMNDFGYLACYRMIDGIAKQQWEFYAEEPQFDDGFLNKRVLKDGFWDVNIYGNKVFVIYNGKTFEERRSKESRFPNIILSFDLYTGKLCEKYVTNRDICRFTIDEVGIVYGVGTNPEVEVVKYKLPNL